MVSIGIGELRPSSGPVSSSFSVGDDDGVVSDVELAVNAEQLKADIDVADFIFVAGEFTSSVNLRFFCCCCSCGTSEYK